MFVELMDDKLYIVSTMIKYAQDAIGSIKRMMITYCLEQYISQRFSILFINFGKNK